MHPDSASDTSLPVAGPVAQRPGAFVQILRGLVDGGHGIDLIVAVLGITVGALRVWASRLGLGDLSDSPFRPSRHPKAWQLHEYKLLAAMWLDGYRVADVGERLGRSPSSIYAKRRFLGLPARDRKDLRPRQVSPESPSRDASPGVADLREGEGASRRSALAPSLTLPRTAPTIDVPKPGPIVPETGFLPSLPAIIRGADPRTDDFGLEAFGDSPLPYEVAALLPRHALLGRRWHVANSPDRNTLRSHQKRFHIEWTRAMREEVILRSFGQLLWAIARDLLVTESALNSERSRLEMPRLQWRGLKLADVFDPGVARENMERSGYRIVESRQIPGLPVVEHPWAERRKRNRLEKRYTARQSFRHLQSAMAL